MTPARLLILVREHDRAHRAAERTADKPPAKQGSVLDLAALAGMQRRG